MGIERKPNESQVEYHKRLIFGKLVDKTLSDLDYSELAELVYGKQYSSDVARRMLYGSCKTLELIDAEGIEGIRNSCADSGDVMSDIDMKIIELHKEQQKLLDQRSALRKIVRSNARREETASIIERAIVDSNLPTLEYVEPIVTPSSNDILVSLNDMHYGATHSNYWGVYNSDVCRKMMSKYLQKIIEIAGTHGSENCIVWENGDVISGLIHKSIQITNKENVVEQVIGASELIAEFLSVLSGRFRTVKFVSVSGNHSRLDPNKDNDIQGERLDDLVEWYLSARLQNFKNIIIGSYEKIDSTMYVVNIRGKDYCGVHGDFDGSETKIHALQTMAGRQLYAVMSGHLHHNKVDEVQGVKTVMAGSFLGMDDYCVRKRIYGRPEQMVCICDESGIVCYYDIALD